jgi:glutamine---fructose-6-phosphate transaminase (isomerizing)
MLPPSKMLEEIQEIPAAIERLLTDGAPAIKDAARALKEADPKFLISVARGSSDHAATYFKYISELRAGLPVASVGPSVASIYGRPLKLKNSACLAISQSGKSPDIVSMATMARSQGALTFALTNHPNSDLARASDHTLDLHAGPELSVAATKTFVASVVSAVWLVAEWTEDCDLLTAVSSLPEVLSKAILQDWSSLIAHVTPRASLYCLGRGPAFAMSNETALKFKETCQLHAESYSSAEVLHGPVSMVDAGFPVLGLTGADAAEDALVSVVDAIAAKGAQVFVTSDKAKHATRLPFAKTAHPLTDPISLIVSAYAMVEQVALARGINPDAPRHLSKVTETI